ncbi:MAG TPA: pyruvate kinase alpha/beta domain-containing protein [bacterium]
MEYQTLYFEQPGPENTGATIRVVKEWADRLNLSDIVVATTSGATGVLAAEQLQRHRVLVVSHAAGFSRENEQEMLPEHRAKIEGFGGRILTTQHAFGGINRAVRFKFNTYELDEIIANALRVLGQGAKVAVEIAMMAADAGLLRTDRDVLAIGGTNSGADTALVVKPANTFRFFDLRIRGVLCKPWTF